MDEFLLELGLSDSFFSIVYTILYPPGSPVSEYCRPHHFFPSVRFVPYYHPPIGLPSPQPFSLFAQSCFHFLAKET